MVYVVGAIKACDKSRRIGQLQTSQHRLFGNQDLPMQLDGKKKHLSSPSLACEYVNNGMVAQVVQGT